MGILMKIKKNLVSTASSLRTTNFKNLYSNVCITWHPLPTIEIHLYLNRSPLPPKCERINWMPQNTYFAKLPRKVASNKIIARFFGKINCSLICKMKGYQRKLFLKNTYVFLMSTDNDHISTISPWLRYKHLCNAIRAKSQNLISWWQVKILLWTVEIFKIEFLFIYIHWFYLHLIF